MKVFAIVLAAAAMLASGVGVASAAGNGAFVDVVQVSFAPLSSATCGSVPEGLSFSWSGPERQVTTVRTDADGVTTVSVVSHASGKAEGSDGQLYQFNYSNEFRVSNSVENPGWFTGVMNDSFAMSGHGFHMSNGFLSTLETDLATTFLFPSQIRVTDDPIDFATGAAHCDPL